MHLTFTSGDTETAIGIMREAARWQIAQGTPLWRLENLTREKIANPDGEFHVAWSGKESAAAMLLSYHDPLFWPEVAAGTSGFVHKLAVRRGFAGQGAAEAMLRHAAALCREKGVPMLRLDTDLRRPRLCALYERAGFRRVDVRQLYSPAMGVTLDVAMYEMEAA